LLKRYIFWTYERGSFHYDVMVTVILLFIFISPHVIDFGDRPVEAEHVKGHDILVQASAGGVLVYQVSAKELKETSQDSANQLSVAQQLVSSIQPIAGTVVLDRYEPVKDANGQIEAYRVFAHRPAPARVQ
jgi:hypothetical protein